MRILFLGGTAFLGRHLGRRGAGPRPRRSRCSRAGARPVIGASAVTARIGDRDPDKAPGLDALREGTWDAVIDTSGYVPRVVRASARAARGPRRAITSSCRRSRSTPTAAAPDQDETASGGAARRSGTEDVAKYYGPLKAACEDEVRAAFGDGAIIVRPGLIVGPHDSSDRFGYWVARFRHPALLGDRPGAAVVPAPPAAPMQFIDARDLADWMIDLVERQARAARTTRCSPARHWTMGDIVDALRARRRCAASRRGSTRRCCSSTRSSPGPACRCGFPRRSPTRRASWNSIAARRRPRACASGRSRTPSTRPAQWLAARDNAGAWKAVLTAAHEREILAFAAPAVHAMIVLHVRRSRASR